MATTLINGRAYDHAQIRVNIAGVQVHSVTALNYTEEQEKANNFGVGNRPVSRGHGAIEASGSITLGMNDVEAIRDAAPNGSLLQVPSFQIVVVFDNPQKVVTHTVKDVEFLDDGMESDQGSTNIERAFAFVASEVKYR